MMDAAEAERSGLVSRIVPAEKLLEDAMKTAGTIAAMPPLAAMMNKEMVDMAFETTLDTGLVLEHRMFQVLTATEDNAAGMKTFVAKRPGVWKGRQEAVPSRSSMARRLSTSEGREGTG